MPLATLRQLTLTSLIALTLTACGGSSDGDDEPRRSSSSSSNSSESSSSTSSDSSSTTSSSSSSSSAEAEDLTPNAFSFAPQEGLEPGSEAISEEVTIEGINRAVAIRIEGGEYQLNGAEFTAENGELESGSTLTLRTTAPEELGDTQEVTVTIGTETTTWSVTTAVDDEPPEGAIAFPPPMSASGAETLTIRGRASDELSEVAEVTLTVHHEDSSVPYTLEPDEETGFAEWQQSITLAPGENRVSLQVRDEAGNELEEPVEVTVVGQDYATPFPDDEQGQFEIGDMVYDESHNRLLLLGSDEDEGVAEDRAVLAVDLNTGIRSVFATNDGENESASLGFLNVGTIDPENNRLIAARDSGNAIYEFDLETGIGTELLQSRSGDNASAFDLPRDIVMSSDSESIYILSGSNGGDYDRLLKVNLVSGDQEVISDAEAGIGEGPDFGLASGIVISEDEGLAYINARIKLYQLDLTNGSRAEVPLDYPAENIFRGLNSLFIVEEGKGLYIFESYQGLMKKGEAIDDWSMIYSYDENGELDSRLAQGVSYLEEHDYFFVAQDHYKAVFAYDLVTNEFVVITRYSE